MSFLLLLLFSAPVTSPTQHSLHTAATFSVQPLIGPEHAAINITAYGPVMALLRDRFAHWRVEITELDKAFLVPLNCVLKLEFS